MILIDGKKVSEEIQNEIPREVKGDLSNGRKIRHLTVLALARFFVVLCFICVITCSCSDDEAVYCEINTGDRQEIIMENNRMTLQCNLSEDLISVMIDFANDSSECVKKMHIQLSESDLAGNTIRILAQHNLQFTCLSRLLRNSEIKSLNVHDTLFFDQLADSLQYDYADFKNTRNLERIAGNLTYKLEGTSPWSLRLSYYCKTEKGSELAEYTRVIHFEKILKPKSGGVGKLFCYVKSPSDSQAY